MKGNRQTAIAELISAHDIGKQETLLELLKTEKGIEVAQATISRDLRQMNIIKASDGHGGFRFMLPPENPADTFMQYVPAFTGFIRSVDYSLNDVVIRTSNGMANAVAVGLDSAEYKDILGCVAGDDCIIVVARSEEKAKEIRDSIVSMMEKYND